MGQRCGTIKHLGRPKKHRSVSACFSIQPSLIILNPYGESMRIKNFDQFWPMPTWCGWHWMALDGTWWHAVLWHAAAAVWRSRGPWDDGHCLGMAPPTLQALRPFDSACMALYGCLQRLGQFGNTIFTAVALAANSVALQSSSYLETSTFE